jgi:hypothetical protein
MSEDAEAIVGGINLVLCDSASGEVILLGGMRAITQDELNAAWDRVPAFPGETAFMADKLDANEDIVDDRPISGETVAVLMGQPISELITTGRRRLADELVAEIGPSAARHIPGFRDSSAPSV